jgi:hypothetical protein
MSRANKAASWAADTAKGTLTVTFADGSSRTLDVGNLPSEMILRLALHGAEQKGRDSYAGAKEAIAEGKATDATEYAKEQAGRVLDNLEAGVWAERATGNGGDLARAVAEVTGKEVAEIAEVLRGKTDEEKAKLKANPKVAAAIKRFEAERAAARAKAAAAKAEDAEDDGEELEL